MYTLRCTLFCLLFTLFGSSSAFSQVFEVDFLLEYTPDSCGYIASIIVVNGNAISPQNRAQFNSTYTIVVPNGRTVTVEDSYNPKLDNLTSGNGTTPIEWSISNFVQGPPITPDLSYFSVIPDISVASFHNNTLQGDTIRLFKFNVTPGLDMCGEEVRLFINPFLFDGSINPDPNADPSSSEMPGGQDYSNGFEFGNDGQDYRNNREQVDPPKPQVKFSIECGSTVTLQSTPIEDLICVNQLPYTYVWSGPNNFSATGENPTIPAGTGSGLYCATIVDAFGCDTIICENLVVEDPESITQTLCTTDPFDLVFSSGGAGFWALDPSSNSNGVSVGSTSNGTATVSFTNSATGVYTFIYDNGGCGGTAELTIMPSSSEPNVTTDGPNCPGENTILTADQISGATYNWNNEGPQSSNMYTVGGPGTVTLEVIVGGCPSTTTIDVMYLDTPDSPTLGVTMPVCEGDEVNFTASNIAGAFDNDYFWTGPNNWNEQNPTISSVSASDAGEYTVIVDIDGCESIPVMINLVVAATPSTPTIDNIDPVCEGEPIQFNTNASASTYTWTQQPPGGNVLTGQSPSITSATASDAGTYILVTSDGGCDSDPVSVVVTVNPKPDTPTADANGPVCVGQIINFTASNVAGATDASYQWTGPNNFNTQNPTINSASLTDAGEYTLIVTVNDCASEPISVNVVVNNTSSAPNAMISSPVCTGDDVNFGTDAVSGASYTWTNSSCPNSPIVTNDAAFTINNIDAACAGTWELTVDLNGCISEPGTSNLEINNTPTTPAPSSNAPLCVGEDLMLFANVTADTYEWTFNLTVISNDENPVITGVTASNAGTYSLVVTTNGCSSETGETTVIINDKPATPDASSNSPICTGDDIQLFTSVVADEYLWTGPGNPGIIFTDQNPVITGSSAIAGTYTLTVTIDGCESEEANTTVTISPTPATPNINANGPLCTGMDLMLTTDEVLGATYSWTGPPPFTSNEQNPTIEDVTLAEDGNYELTIIMNGCSSQSVSVNVDIFPSPDMPTISVDPVCVGSTISFTSDADPTAGFSWAHTESSWTSIQPNPTISGADPALHNGEYTLIVTQNGCPSEPATINFTVTEVAEPTTGSYGPFCLEDDPVALTGTPNGVFSGDGVNPAGDTFTPNDAGQGTHTLTLTVTDGDGCSATNTVDVIVNPLPTADITGDLDICTGESTDLTATGGDFYAWNDDNSSTTPMITVSPTTTTSYEVTVTDGAGCTNTAMVEVVVNPLPTADITGDFDICAGESTDLTATGGDFYAWNDGNSSTTPTITVSPTTTTSYEVTVTDGAGCTNTAMVEVVVNPLPTADITGDLDICAGESTDLTATGGDFYAWNDDNSSTTPMITVSPTTTTSYEVTVTDGAGCTNTAMVEVVVNPLPTADISGDLDICAGESTDLTATGGDFYAWNDDNSSTTPMITVSPTTTTSYEVTVTDGAGCTNTAMVEVVVNPLPTGDITGDLEICAGESTDLTATGGDFYAWNDGNSSTTPMITVSPTMTTSYEVTVTDGAGCTNTAMVEVVVNPNPTVLASATDTEICIGESTTLTASGASTYEWTPGGSGENINVSPIITTTYEVMGTDGNGCTNTAEITIVVNELPVVDAGTYGDVCINDGVITLNGMPNTGGTGIWSGPGDASSGNFNPAVAQAGTHTLTYTFNDGNGCSNTATATITVQDLPVVFAGDYDDVCIDANPIALSGSPANGIFSGHPAINGNFFNPSQSGEGTFTITYTASENGCENTATTTITVNGLPNVDAGTYGPYCDYDNDISLVGSPNGGSFSGPFVNNNIFSPSAAGDGSYEIIYTYIDVNGCMNSANTTIIVNGAPVVTAGIYPDVCVGSDPFEIVGTPANGTFSGMGVNAAGDMFDPSLVIAGTYTISYFYEDPATGCSNIAMADVTVLDAPAMPVITSNSPVCEGETINITVDGVVGGDYMWEGPNGLESTMQDITLTDAIIAQGGIYRVKVTVNGCDSEWADIEVIVNPTPDTPNPTSNSPICEGETIMLMTNAVEGATYAWSGPAGMISDQQNPVITDVSSVNAGQYCLIVTVDGCESEFACVDVTVNDIPNTPQITTTAPVCIGTDISFGTDDVADAYQWYDNNDQPFSNDQYPVLTGSSLAHIGTWSLEITIDGCVSALASIEVDVLPLPIVDAGSYPDMCEDDVAINLIGSPENGIFTINNTEVTIFDPADYTPGTYTIDYVFSDVNGCENSASTTITLNESPTLELISVDCSSDLNSYVITFNSTSTVTAAGETVSGNQVIDIPIENDVILTATTVQGCTVDLPVSAPQCDCPDIAIALSGGDIEICEGETVPVLTATADPGLVVDWYGAPTGSNDLLAAGDFDYQSPETTVGVYTYYAEARNPVDDCVSSVRTPITLTIKDVPNITNTNLTAAICSEESTSGFTLMADQPGTTYSWSVVADNVDGSFSNGVGNIPAEVLTTTADQGTVTYSVIPSLNGCEGAPVDFVVTVNALPTITIENKECSADLSTYTITYTSDYDVTSSGGSPITGGFEGIEAGESVTLTVTNPTTGCITEIEVDAPQCDCDEVAAPINPVDQEICLGDAAQALSVEVGADMTVNWYATAQGGTSLETDVMFTPDDIVVGVYTYYAEATDDITGCVSDTRTAVTYTIHDLPSITIDNKECTADLSMYVITFSGGDVTVVPSNGNLDDDMITVNSAENTILTITDNNTGCISTLEVLAPNCDCSEVPAPISGGNAIMCENDPVPTLTVTVNPGIQANWYDDQGTLIAGGENTTSYTPIVTNAGVVQVYEVEAVNPVDNCVSNTRTQVTLTINELPTVDITDKECADDFLTYSFAVTTTGVISNVSHGNLSGDIISGVPGGQVMTFDITLNGCTVTESVSAPVCACDPINPPTIADGAICFGDVAPTFTSTLIADQTIDWYEADCTTLILSGDSYTPVVLSAGDIMICAIIRNTIDGCESDPTTFTLSVNDLPMIDLVGTTCNTDNTMYDVELAGTGTITSTIGIVNGNIISGVPVNTNIIVTIEDDNGCTNTLEVIAPDCACDPIDPPQADDVAICEGETNPIINATVSTDQTVDWYLADCVTPIAVGALSYEPTDTDPGTYTYCLQARNLNDGCVSEITTTVTFTINELPTINIDSKDCTADLQDYVIIFSGSDVTVTASEGSVNGNEITVPEGINTILTITDNVTGCISTLDVLAPDCNCPDMDAPISGGDQEICENDPNPELSVTVDAGMTARWYIPGNNVAVNTGLTYTPSVTTVGVQVYEVETYNPSDECVSTTRTEVRLTIKENPAAIFSAIECSADLQTYSLTITTDATFTTSHGQEAGNQIVDIPEGQDIVITLTQNGCTATEIITAPVCACDPIDPPVSDDVSICVGESNPILSATVNTGETVDWYESDCTTPLATGTLSYSPIPTAAGIYTYCLVTRNIADNCISDLTTSVTLTINELPTISFGIPECSTDLQTYSVTYTSTHQVTTDIGDISNGIIENIPTGINPIVTITNTTTTCSITETINAPTCECDDVTVPVIVSNPSICEDEANPVLEVTSTAGTSVVWYDMLVGGTVLSNDLTFTSPETEAGTYTYYVEAVDDVTGCASDRVAVTFTIHALPTIDVTAKDCAADMLTYSITYSGDVTILDVTPSGTISSGMMITDIDENIDIVITFSDNVTNCVNTLNVTAPNCDCDEVAAPILSGDEEICEGEQTPTFSTGSLPGITYLWYTQSLGGTSINTGLTFTPEDIDPGVYTYYVEAVFTDGCTSNVRTPVTLTIHALPTLLESDKECSADLQTYTVTINTTADITGHSEGDLSGNVISNIQSGLSFKVTITDPTTNCEAVYEIESPECECDDVPEPTVTNGEACVESDNPFLMANVATGYTINWYDEQVAGNSLAIDAPSYQPAITDTGIHTFWVEARDNITGCLSDRVAITLTIHELPTLVVSSADCSADLSTYTVTVNTSAIIISSTLGDVNGLQIENITAEENIEVEIQDPLTGCLNTVVIEAPDCDCTPVDLPVSGGNVEICFGEVIPELSATTTGGLQINWYENQSIEQALLLNSTTYQILSTATGTYTVYAAAYDPITECESDRIPVTLSINAIPVITNVDRAQEVCSGNIAEGFEIESDVSGATFTWTAVGTDVTGFTTSGTGDIDAELLTNTSAGQGSIVYTVTPILNGCVGDDVEFIITVSPTPNAGDDQSADCYINAEFTLNAMGEGIWSAGNNEAQAILIDDVDNPATRLSGFTEAGTYQFIWTVAGCADFITITINDNCPCIIEGNNLLDDVQDTYCANTDILVLMGDEALPLGGTYEWQVDIDGAGFVPASGVNNSKNYDASNLGEGNYIFRRNYMVESNGDLCDELSNEIEFLVFSDKVIPGEIMFDPNPVCQGDTLFLMVDDYNPDLTYDWSVSSGNARVIYQLDSMSSIVVETSGTISVSVTQSLTGCFDGDASGASTLDIEVNPNPQPRLGIDTTFCELDETYFLNPGVFEDYLWMDGSDDASYEVEGEGIYSVEVTDTLGCVGKDEIDIKSFCCDFVWPNIFKADGYGVNNMFEITDMYSCAITSKLYIYDRWGNLIFLGENTTQWDGTFNGKPVEQGVYVFIYEYSAEDADREIFEDKLSGDITVIRDR